MGYGSRGKRPEEYASKASHGYLIKDPSVQEFLSECVLPKSSTEINLGDAQIVKFISVAKNPVTHVVAVDGGYHEIAVKAQFPSSTICFFQFGALVLSIHDLDRLEIQPFIDPDDISRLKQIERKKCTMPVKNVSLKKEGSLVRSVRRAVYDFFASKVDNDSLLESVRWLIFEEYGAIQKEWNLSNCPTCRVKNVPMEYSKINAEGILLCPQCSEEIYLTDVFRLHEAIDEDLGAGGVLGYLTTTIEQMMIVHLIRLILQLKPSLLDEIMFIRDGPLAFFGQTANLHKPMRGLVKFLLEKHNLFLTGLEKSGAFVEHAHAVSGILEPGTALLLNDQYIYKYIVPGKVGDEMSYGRTTYYSNKVIFKTSSGAMYVICVPTTTINGSPSEDDLPNLQIILANVEKLQCDMYDSALVPVALANKLVSLSNHPSSRILQRFAMQAVNR